MRHPFNPEAILHLPVIANLATTCSDGPRNAPVWFIWEHEVVWMLASTTGSSVQRLRLDPRCAVEIVHYDNSQGILLHLGFRGCATIEASCKLRFKRLLSKYLGPEEAAWNPWFVENIACIDAAENRMIKLLPESTFSSNESYFRTGPHLAWPI